MLIKIDTGIVSWLKTRDLKLYPEDCNRAPCEFNSLFLRHAQGDGITASSLEIPERGHDLGSESGKLYHNLWYKQKSAVKVATYPVHALFKVVGFMQEYGIEGLRIEVVKALEVLFSKGLVVPTPAIVAYLHHVASNDKGLVALAPDAEVMIKKELKLAVSVKDDRSKIPADIAGHLSSHTLAVLRRIQQLNKRDVCLWKLDRRRYHDSGWTDEDEIECLIQDENELVALQSKVAQRENMKHDLPAANTPPPRKKPGHNQQVILRQIYSCSVSVSMS